MTDARAFSFDGWSLRPTTGELARAGKTQRLTQQPLRLLVELLEHPGEVVSRERLVELLWPKGVVDFDNGLNVAVRKVRIALGDDTETPRYIETLPRIGYRFIGKLDEPMPPASPAPAAAPTTRSIPRWTWLVVMAGLLLGAAIWYFATARAPQPAPVPSNGPLVARRTTSVRAYEHYLQGVYHRSRRDTNATDQAIASFEAALEEDPEYSEAWAGLAETLMGAAIGHHLSAEPALQRARQAAQRAVALDPGITEAHTALGHSLMLWERDYVAAEAEYMKAREVNEKYARLWHHLGILRAYQGRPDEALAAMRRARELEPMTLLFNANYGLVLYHSRRYDEVIAHLEPLLASQPTLDQARSTMIRALIAKGEFTRAQEHLALRRGEKPNLSDAGLLYAHTGEREKALQEIARIERMSAQGFAVGYELTVLRAAIGDMAGGCAALQLAVRDHSPFLGWMRLDPRLDPLRGEPCFETVEAWLGSGKPLGQ
jgi:DNA-binding winged helix-turn-helix (wHTH) protein/tetratricopeptide (TPR) repeat protein